MNYCLLSLILSVRSLLDDLRVWADIHLDNFPSILSRFWIYLSVFLILLAGHCIFLPIYFPFGCCGAFSKGFTLGALYIKLFFLIGESASVWSKAISNLPTFYGLIFKLSFFATGSSNLYGLLIKKWVTWLMELVGIFCRWRREPSWALYCGCFGRTSLEVWMLCAFWGWILPIGSWIN